MKIILNFILNIKRDKKIPSTKVILMIIVVNINLTNSDNILHIKS
jgi:hypothetical protein